MRVSSMCVAVVLTVLVAGCKSTPPSSAEQSVGVFSSRKVVAGCATCIFGMKEVADCKLAVKIDDTPYLVVGSGIDDHGNAHAADGLCNAAREAVVVGRIEQDRFVATKFDLQP